MEKRADWLVVTGLQVHVAAIAELIDVPAPPKDSVTPCWHTTLSTARKHKLPQESNSSNVYLSPCSSWPCSSLHPIINEHISSGGANSHTPQNCNMMQFMLLSSLSPLQKVYSIMLQNLNPGLSFSRLSTVLVHKHGQNKI